MEANAATIETGVPAILCSAFWNLVAPSSLTLSSSIGDVVSVTTYAWGDPITSTVGLRKEDPETPEEYWDDKWEIGHAVTGAVVKDRERLWVIVHDNWSTNAENVMIPWEHVVALIRLLPRRRVP